MQHSRMLIHWEVALIVPIGAHGMQDLSWKHHMLKSLGTNHWSLPKSIGRTKALLMTITWLTSAASIMISEKPMTSWIV